MKNKIISTVALILFAITTIGIVNAASFNVSAPSNLEINKTGSLVISGNVTGKYTITSSNSSVASVSNSSVWVEAGKMDSGVTITAKGNGTANITVTASNVADSNTGADITGSITKTVTVTSPVTPPNNNTNTGNSNTNKKNTNNYLKSLSINVDGLSPEFSKNTFNYTLTVNESINEITIKSIAEDAKSKIAISGNKDLKVGNNTVTVTVTAENGSKRNYIITVNKTNNPDLSNVLLENIVIANGKFKTEFLKEVFEYECEEIDFNVNSLNLEIFTENKKAKYEVIGNENLKVGENIITIKVTSEDGNTTKDYVIKVIKKENTNIIEEQNPLKEDTTPPDGRINQYLRYARYFIQESGLIVLLLALCIVEFIQVAYLYNKTKKINTNYITKDEKIEKEIEVDSLRRRNKDVENIEEREDEV